MPVDHTVTAKLTGVKSGKPSYTKGTLRLPRGAYVVGVASGPARLTGLLVVR